MTLAEALLFLIFVLFQSVGGGVFGGLLAPSMQLLLDGDWCELRLIGGIAVAGLLLGLAATYGVFLVVI